MAAWPSYPFWRGFWNMGRPRLPLPPYIVMTDRSTGVDYYLSQEGEPGFQTVLLEVWDGSIRQPFHDYGLDGGPYLNKGTIKLYIDEETLLAEAVETDHGYVSDPRIFTREAFDRDLIEITAPLDWAPGDPLVYTEVDV